VLLAGDLITELLALLLNLSPHQIVNILLKDPWHNLDNVAESINNAVSQF
jgi:hypothetical protein